jgi:hypothetical protein
MQEPQPDDDKRIDAADIIPSVPMPIDAAEAERRGVTPHPSGLNRSQRRAAYKAHRRRR